MALPPHRNLEGYDGTPDDYQRLSVACGLAQDSFSLGRIVPAKEVEDDVALTSAHIRERLSHEELYAK